MQPHSQVGTGLAASLGIVPYGGGEAFQNALKIDAVVFDKTGTITKGEFKVEDHVLLPFPSPRPAISSDGKETATEWREELIWRLVEATEEGSAHPISVGLREFCRSRIVAASQRRTEREVKVRIIKNEEIPGRGLSVAAVFGREGEDGRDEREVDLLLGNEELLRETEVPLEGISAGGGYHDFVGEASSKGHSIIFLALRFPLPSSSSTSSPSSSTTTPPSLATPPPPGEGSFHLTSLFSLTDPPRPESAYVISHLAKMGITSFMCTGDNLSTAQEVARVVGIDESRVKAGVGPQEKGEFVRGLQGEGWSGGKRGRGWEEEEVGMGEEEGRDEMEGHVCW